MVNSASVYRHSEGTQALGGLACFHGRAAASLGEYVRRSIVLSNM